MFVCLGCHRHVRPEETACPFCGTAIQTASAPNPARLGAMAFVVGLGLLGCADKGGDDPMETETGMTTNTTMTTMTMTTETGGMDTSTGDTTTGDGDGDMNSTDADYGGPTTFDETGDGDGDPTGDGDGDGDGEPGDGDGDGDMTGDGDGDGDSGGADYGGAPPSDPNSH
jgi:hypothetical protein